MKSQRFTQYNRKTSISNSLQWVASKGALPIYIHMYMHIYIHTYTHTHTHISIYIHALKTPINDSDILNMQKQ